MRKQVRQFSLEMLGLFWVYVDVVLDSDLC